MHVDVTCHCLWIGAYLKYLKAHLIGEHWYPEAAPVRSEPHFSEVWRDHTRDEVVEETAKKGDSTHQVITLGD